MGHGLREPLERRRRVRPLPAREDRPAVRPERARDRARHRLPPAGRRRLTVGALPIRVRLTLPFALAMALVLAALGVFVYLRVGETLLAGVDQGLGAQSTEALGRLEDEQSLLDRDAV